MSAATIQKPILFFFFFALLNESIIKFGATLEDQIWGSSTKEAIIRLDVIEGMNTIEMFWAWGHCAGLVKHS